MFLALVPKKGRANDIDDFRPISLGFLNGEDFTSLVGCKMGKLSTYLDFSLGASLKLRAVWEAIEAYASRLTLKARLYKLALRL
ncbi:hypothetical protein CK203_084278 [Vitis vinifera]|uniref:Uncharacterized protein n=1 Tax=Vitis vinifera TaxID=29760 RepID=A0A438BMQ2_VITVI|nr:hypothetical protein CK203_084278 [Vitis vinifera]